MRRRAGERGFSLMLVVFVILILGIAVGALESLLTTRANLFVRQARGADLRALGDGAMSATLVHLAANHHFRALPAARLGDGWIESQITHHIPHGVHVLATSSANGWEQTIDADVDLTGAPTILTWSRSAPRRASAFRGH